jgi:hypothetical protein
MRCPTKNLKPNNQLLVRDHTMWRNYSTKRTDSKIVQSAIAIIYRMITRKDHYGKLTTLVERLFKGIIVNLDNHYRILIISF